MKLSEYYDQLERHDWFYEYSDDHSVWTRGNQSLAKLQMAAAESPAHQELYTKYRNHKFSGMINASDRKVIEPTEKPERPND